MQDLVTAALDRGDYTTAANLLQQWKQNHPQDPWLLVMVGQYQEATGRWEAAEKTYLKLLRQVSAPKLMNAARQGIQRVQGHLKQARDEALEAARTRPESQSPGLLCLMPVQGEARQAAAQGLARIMQIDPYTARLQLPSQGWRLYRVGPVGELQYFSDALCAAQAPAFWVKQADIKALQVFRVQHFREVANQGTVVCQSPAGQTGTIKFAWHEVTQLVRGQLPVFESVVDLGAWGKLQRKEKTQDYAEVLDLHLHGRRCVLRLCDRTYQFRQGHALPQPPSSLNQQAIIRPHWNRLIEHLQTQVPRTTQTGFTKFGAGALEYIDLLPPFEAHLNISRRSSSNWDAAFHLYSGLHFLRFSN